MHVHDHADRDANFVSTAYTMPRAVGRPERPVVFLVNGGPSVSSAILQFGGVGPRLMTFPNGPGSLGRIAENGTSPITAADLVFIDPVGTGFSHAITPSKDSDFWGVEPDTDSIASFVQAWLKVNGRSSAPVIVLGESYGGFRAIEVAHKLMIASDPPKVRGVVVVSGAIDFVAGASQPGEDKGYPQIFPSWAAAAWYHGKIDHRGRSFAEFLKEAETFASGEYPQALLEGNRMTADDRTRIAVKMSEFVGIPAKDILLDDLRIDDFNDRLLVLDGKVLNRTDGRVTTVAGRPAEHTTIEAIMAAAPQAYESEFGAICPSPYLSRSVLKAWDWAFTYGSPDVLDVYLSATGVLARDMDAHPELHSFIAGGRYDMMVGYFGSETVAAHMPNDSRTSSKTYDGGHAFYLKPGPRAEFNADLKAFIHSSTGR